MGNKSLSFAGVITEVKDGKILIIKKKKSQVGLAHSVVVGSQPRELW